MALRMPRPITNASGVYHLNIRVPGDVAAKVKGTVVTLPVAGAQVTVRPSDKVIVSLRTKDPSLAKARFCEAESALSRHWDALRRGPVSLTHVQLVALAGECYRATVKAFEDDPNYIPDGYLCAARQFEADVAYWRKNDDDDARDIGERHGLVLAWPVLAGRSSWPTSAAVTSTSSASPSRMTMRSATFSGRRPTSFAACGTLRSTRPRGCG